MSRLKSCSSCGRIHKANFICDKKQASIKANKERYRDKNKGKKDIRFTQSWKRKAAEIKKRDLCICQMCIRKIEMLESMRLYNYLDTQVHHIIKIVDDDTKVFDNENLITLCRYHHELVENKKEYINTLKDIACEQENKNK